MAAKVPAMREDLKMGEEIAPPCRVRCVVNVRVESHVVRVTCESHVVRVTRRVTCEQIPWICPHCRNENAQPFDAAQYQRLIQCGHCRMLLQVSTISICREQEKKAIRNSAMTEDEVAAEKNRYDYLMTQTTKERLEILETLRETEPGLWEAEDGDALMDAFHLPELSALYILRLEHASAGTLTKGAGGADVSSVKDEVQGKEPIPPDHPSGCELEKCT